jgi:transcriptional regulator with XRE-family HTH domain
MTRGDVVADKSGPLAEIGSAIAQARLEKGLTREQLRQAAGISLEYVGKIERNARTPQPAKLVAIAQALGTTVADLMRRAQDLRLTQSLLDSDLPDPDLPESYLTTHLPESYLTTHPLSADLSVAINLPGSADAGKSFIATMTVCNHGPQVAVDVKSEMKMPADIDVVECDHGVVSSDKKIVLFREPRLEVLQPQVYVITARAADTAKGDSRKLIGRILSPTTDDREFENDVDERSLKITARAEITPTRL